MSGNALRIFLGGRTYAQTTYVKKHGFHRHDARSTSNSIEIQEGAARHGNVLGHQKEMPPNFPHTRPAMLWTLFGQQSIKLFELQTMYAFVQNDNGEAP